MPEGMTYSEATHKQAWIIVKHHTRRHCLWGGTTPEGMAYTEVPHQHSRAIIEAPHQKVWPVVRHHTSRHGIIPTGMVDRETHHQLTCRNEDHPAAALNQ